jgi:hypothetical protein
MRLHPYAARREEISADIPQTSTLNNSDRRLIASFVIMHSVAITTALGS